MAFSAASRARIAHALDVANLAGKVEDDRAAADFAGQRRGIPHVGDNQTVVAFGGGEIVPAGAATFHFRVHNHHVCAGAHQPQSQVTANET